MFRIALLIAMNFVHAQLNQAPCTEDSHCSIGFYCEETALYCRKCLSCEDLKRESPLQGDACLKSVVQCGDCLEGLVEESANENLNTGCVTFIEGTGTQHPYLPSYAWAAIALGLFLMLLTVCVFLKAKMFKVVSYSSRTSVHSMRAAEDAEREAVAPRPPPYNYHLPHAFPSASSGATEMPEIRRLVDSPELSSKPSSEPPAWSPREAAENQEARVFNNPAYVRIPQSNTRCNTPEVSTPESETAAIPVVRDTGTEELTQPTGNIVKNYNTVTDVPRDASHNSAGEWTQRNRALACSKVQDSNNNHPESPGAGGKRGGTTVFGGPSFVINVVENVHNLHQRNHASCYHLDPS